MTYIFWIIEYAACFVEFFMFTLFNGTFLEEDFKQNTAKKIILSLAAAMIMTLSNTISLFSSITMLINTVSAFLLEFFIYRVKPLKIIAFNITFILIIFLIDSITVRTVSFFNNIAISEIYEEMSVYRALSVIVSKLLLIFATVSIHKLFYKKSSLNKKYTIALFLISVIIVLLTLSMTFKEIEYDTVDNSISIMLFAVILILLIMIFFGMFSLTEAYERSQELKLIKLRNDMLEKSFSDTQQNFELWRKSIHDYKHNIINLSALAENNDIQGIKEYLKNENNMLSQKIFYYKTGNDTVDAILYIKQQNAESSHIPFIINANIPEKCPVSSAHFACLLGNLLDNAIEAAKTVAPDDGPFIDVRLTDDEDRFWIIVSNKYIPANKTKNNIFHGIGLNSVRHIVRKYSGEMNINRENHVFTVKIYIPMFQSTP